MGATTAEGGETEEGAATDADPRSDRREPGPARGRSTLDRTVLPPPPPLEVEASGRDERALPDT